jgi:hypothetical protein
MLTSVSGEVAMTNYGAPADQPGQPYGQPAGQYSDSGPLAPPRMVTVAFWLFLLAVLAHLVEVVVSAVQAPAAIQHAKDQVANSSANTSGVDVNGIIGASVVITIVFGVLFIVAFIVFDLFMRRGANWARIVLLIVTILSLTGVISLYGVGAIGVIAAVVAVILTFLPASNAYFRAVKDRKLAARGR